MSAEPVIVARRHDVLFATINRPESRNALAPEIVDALAAVLDVAERDEAVRALVLRGAGGCFCAGGNVGSFQARLNARPFTDGQVADGASADDPVAARNRIFGHFMQRLAALPVPVVAAIEGVALGGGMGLACAADVVLATEDARFGLSETSLGIIPAQIAPFVVARLGRRMALRLGLSNERVRGPAAIAVGLVDELASDGPALDALLVTWLNRITDCGPQANRVLKPLLQRCGDEPVGVLLDDAAVLFARCMRDEGGEGIAAFRERRPARWQVRFTADEVHRAHRGA